MLYFSLSLIRITDAMIILKLVSPSLASHKCCYQLPHLKVTSPNKRGVEAAVNTHTSSQPLTTSPSAPTSPLSPASVAFSGGFAFGFGIGRELSTNTATDGIDIKTDSNQPPIDNLYQLEMINNLNRLSGNVDHIPKSPEKAHVVSVVKDVPSPVDLYRSQPYYKAVASEKGISKRNSPRGRGRGSLHSHDEKLKFNVNYYQVIINDEQGVRHISNLIPSEPNSQQDDDVSVSVGVGDENILLSCTEQQLKEQQVVERIRFNLENDPDPSRAQMLQQVLAFFRSRLERELLANAGKTRSPILPSSII